MQLRSESHEHYWPSMYLGVQTRSLTFELVVIARDLSLSILYLKEIKLTVAQHTLVMCCCPKVNAFINHSAV